MTVKLERRTFISPRSTDFFTRAGLTTQTGHAPEEWPLVVLKELLDNALDACEEADVAPVIRVALSDSGISVRDNGPGIKPETVEALTDFDNYVSSKLYYRSPCRGAQGNALKTLLATPFVLNGSEGGVEIEARGVRHVITLKRNDLHPAPIVDHQHTEGDDFVKTGTRVRVRWPVSACSLLEGARERFLQLASAFAMLNPHLDLGVRCFGNRSRRRWRHAAPTDPVWKKWLPSWPTSAHWYTPDDLGQLILAHVRSVGVTGAAAPTVREFVKSFDGLSHSAKQQTVTEKSGLSGVRLDGMVKGGRLDVEAVRRLHAAMKAQSRTVKSKHLGVIGKNHLSTRLAATGCDAATIKYAAHPGEKDGAPFLVEVAFGYRLKGGCDTRRLVAGVNWSAAIGDPFSRLQAGAESLRSVLQEQRAGVNEPVVVVVHVASPRAAFADKGKSALAGL